MTKQIPNILTLSNLFCGCCALLYVLSGQIETAALFTLSSFVFDYLDGMTARALKVSSPMGKELDSLADVVSFGVVPGAMLYMMLRQTNCGELSIVPGAQLFAVCTAALPAFVLSMFAAFRLGKFNLDTRQTSYFLGLSTPACTVLVLGLALASARNHFGINDWLLQNWLLYALVLVLSLLMISEIPMFGMKIKKLDWQSNAINIGFLLIFAALFWFLGELALPLIILLYIAASIVLKKTITG